MKDRNKKGQFVVGSKHPRKKIEFNLELLKKEYLSGKSTSDLSKEFNATQKTIYNRLKESGIELRKFLTEEQKEKIKQTCIRKGIHPIQRYNGKAWNKGLTKEDYLKHYKNGEVWNKDKIGVQVSNKKDKKFEEIYGERTNEIKHKIRLARSKQIFPLQDTGIELKIKSFLDQLKIIYEQHKVIQIKHFYQCDFFIPVQEGINKPIVLECDGCYWHGCNCLNKELTKHQKKQICKDNKRTKEVKGKNFKVMRLWEHDIIPMTLEEFNSKIHI